MGNPDTPFILPFPSLLYLTWMFINEHHLKFSNKIYYLSSKIEILISIKLKTLGISHFFF